VGAGLEAGAHEVQPAVGARTGLWLLVLQPPPRPRTGPPSCQSLWSRVPAVELRVALLPSKLCSRSLCPVRSPKESGGQGSQGQVPWSTGRPLRAGHWQCSLRPAALAGRDATCTSLCAALLGTRGAASALRPGRAPSRHHHTDLVRPSRMVPTALPREPSCQGGGGKGSLPPCLLF
jgi:hypothetical protein